MMLTASKDRECWHAFGHSGMDVVQTGYDDSNCFTLLFDLSLNYLQVHLSVRK